MLAIYEDSKTYIVDADLENVVQKMRSIVRMDKPYREIPKLPELREQFMDCYAKVLEEQAAPVMNSIKQDRERVLEVLNIKPYKEAKLSIYQEKFNELYDGAERCNNVSTLRSFADKAEALKLRLLDEMDKEDIRLAKRLLTRQKSSAIIRKENLVIVVKKLSQIRQLQNRILLIRCAQSKIFLSRQLPKHPHGELKTQRMWTST